MSIRALLRYSPVREHFFALSALFPTYTLPFPLFFELSVGCKRKTSDVENWRCGKLEMWKTGNVGISLKAIRASVPYFPLPFSA
ncbi:hypothetical protein POVWA2_050310 [Plasmodium ovale wallikeri]|uniref:Uncharacterized protein n=1 Tax=Plasmodium ovale wallikeri TaxID=864142 RepID=A0A1A8ZP05_PLAOA|nr:hypothetical protein POVWA2_050310 [Plasmodium ovale wallikeri]